MSSNMNDSVNAINWTTLNNVLMNQFSRDKIIGAEKLQNINSIEELFGRDFFKIIYFGNYKDMGHWTVLFDKGEGVIEFFCSYGQIYDEIKDFCIKLKLECHYNQIQLQADNTVICAKYCIARINNFPNEIDEFVGFLHSIKGVTPDEIINFLFVVKEFNGN